MATSLTKRLSTSTVALATAQAAIMAPLVPAIASAEASMLPVDAELNTAPSEVTGTIFLTSANAEVAEFMLVSDMGVCPMCGSADHGIAVEVQLDQAMALEHGGQITVKGTLETLTEGDHLATRMLGAEIL